MAEFTFDCHICGTTLETKDVAQVIAFDKEHPCFVADRTEGEVSTIRMNTDHLAPLRALEGPALRTFVNMLAPHFAHHDALDRDTLVRYAAEAEATS